MNVSAIAEKQIPVLAGMQDALAGLRECPEPLGWKDLYPDFAGSDNAELRARRSTRRAVRQRKSHRGIARPADECEGGPGGARTAAIELLARRRVAGLAAPLQALLADPAVRGVPSAPLAAYPDAETPRQILAAYPRFTAGEKIDAVQTLVARTAWAGHSWMPLKRARCRGPMCR